MFAIEKRFKHSLIAGIVISVMVVMFIFILFIISVVQFGKYDGRVHHFENINVCSKYDEFVVEEKIADKYIDGFSYKDSYVQKLNYKGNFFKIYAYVFEDINEAKKYCKSVVSSCDSEGVADYKIHTGLGLIGPNSSMIARYEDKVYRIEAGNTGEFIKILDLINSTFEVDIKKMSTNRTQGTQGDGSVVLAD